MPVGLNVTIANSILDALLSGTAWTPPAACYVQLHVGDPGAAGTANVSSFTTRTQVLWSAAAGGVKSVSAPVTITASWSGTNNEQVTHVSYWDSLTSGGFVTSDQLQAPVTCQTGAPVSIPSLTAPLTPIAA